MHRILHSYAYLNFCVFIRLVYVVIVLFVTPWCAGVFPLNPLRCVTFSACFQVMKRVRTEQIQYAVAQYLKRRQYVDTDGSLKGAKLFQTAEEMAASLTGELGYLLRWRW